MRELYGTGGELEAIRAMKRTDAILFYREMLRANDREALRWLARNDRFFLLGCLMMRQDVLEKDWCYERCREVEARPDGMLDLWSRFHYKSTIITLAGGVQEILKDPEMTEGILSYNKPIANKFVDQIRRALEQKELFALFPDILWEKPPRQNWSTQGGLIVKRRSNPKEATVQGSGLVDGQPIGAHYRLRIYDDVVVPSSVTTPEQIAKTTEAWELSLALGTEDGGREWYAGTRYHPDDTYAAILKRGALVERRRICMDEDGRPLMMEAEALEALRVRMGQNTFAAQMLQNPIASGVRTFKDEWLMFYDRAPKRETMNVYIFVDGAVSKRKKSDRTAMWVVGYGQDRNRYLLDGVYDRVNLAQKTAWIFALHRKWRPNLVFWEQVGPMSDVEHVRLAMNEENYRFAIATLSRGPLDAKRMRIENLQAPFEAGRWWLPRTLVKPLADGGVEDIMQTFIDEEYKTYPISKHDDGLDCLADTMDVEVTRRTAFPMEAEGAGAAGRNGGERTNNAWRPY